MSAKTPEEKRAEQREKQRQHEAALAYRAKDGDAGAREELILSQLSFVDQMVYRYSGMGVSSDELRQEACYGLILAVDRFDPEAGASLRTFSKFYIRKYLIKALTQYASHPVVLKEKSARYVRMCRHAVDKLRYDLGRSPSVQEISEFTGLKPGDVLTCLSCAAQAVSRDDPTVDIYQLLSYDSGDRTTEVTVMNSLEEICLDDFPVKLTSREEEVLRRRCGFVGDGSPQSFVQIGKDLGLSDDTIALVYKTAISKLRDSKKV